MLGTAAGWRVSASVFTPSRRPPIRHTHPPISASEGAAQDAVACLSHRSRRMQPQEPQEPQEPQDAAACSKPRADPVVNPKTLKC
eukprot:1195968-Prorocentrum_minimum.AAC.2